MKYVIIPLLIASIITLVFLNYPKKPKLGSQTISWVKPTTDDGWAEDVKQENFDIKSSDVLQQMLSDSNAQLVVDQKILQKFIDCPQCINYDWYQGFLAEGYTDINAHAEADKQTLAGQNNIQFSVDKLTQSIERINHELDLRARGIVVPDKKDIKGTPTKATDLQKVAPKYIRKIND